MHPKPQAHVKAACPSDPDHDFRAPDVAVHVGYAMSRRGIPAPASFCRWVEAALRGARRPGPAELSIRVVGGREGRHLNRQYRGRDHATNVLSFPVELPRGVASPLLGDLVICAPVVRRESREQHKAARNHFAHLTVHGVLHLLGHDHQDDCAAARMEALEVRILAGLGVADPYAWSRTRRTARPRARSAHIH